MRMYGVIFKKQAESALFLPHLAEDTDLYAASQGVSICLTASL